MARLENNERGRQVVPLWGSAKDTSGDTAYAKSNDHHPKMILFINRGYGFTLYCILLIVILMQ